MTQLLCRHRTAVEGLTKYYLLTVSRKAKSSNVFRVNIGDVTLVRSLPKNLELVPVNYGSENANISQSVLRHIRWMMQKDKLKQDIFLIGPPGALKRTLAMQYLELTKKEVEYVSLSRDTTESDIKQRREIKSRTAHYVDQCAVRAAIEGRTLILDGIEKTERNVLPILNNLLENREMQLDDGRFLMAAERYDKLLEMHTKEEMDKMNLVRVSEYFQVVALGLPVPRYRGNPLDPPLRSRFQARDINPLPFQEYLEILKGFGPSVEHDSLILLLSAAYTLNSPESKSLGLPDFPLDQLPSLVKLMDKIPGLPLSRLVNMIYPYDLFLGKEGQESVKDAFLKFGISAEKVTKTPEISSIIENSPSSEIDSYITANVTEKVSRKAFNYKVMAGTLDPKVISDVGERFINTQYLKGLFSEILHSHSVKDFCVVGLRGCGKSAIIDEFAKSLGYETQLITLYADMTARDLLQHRMTQPNGDTDWKFAPLVTAALNGNLAVLDGLHRINAGTLTVIHRLVHDRELQLFSGARLLRADRYDKIKHTNEWTDEDLKNRDIYRIHPSFRLVALSEPPIIGSSTQQWLSAELLSLFFFHHMRPLSLEEELEVIAGVTKVDKSAIENIVELTHALRSSSDITLQSVASSLSLRQLIRTARRIKHHSNENEYDAIQKACLGRFLPPLTKLALNQVLEDFNVKVPHSNINTSVEALDRAITCEVKQGRVRIGSTEHNVFVPESTAQVPDVLFYDNVQHLTVMEDMLKDFILGEHLLLVGNQGVGKNKIVDRFLHLLNRPREYIQLHRDTMIQSLTLQPTVQDGVIKYEDSPLVRAVKFGKVLVIDEADKAPTNVTCILKTLVESGNMLLADGRRIMKHPDGCDETNVIKMHPNFQMIVLANRPGFPFLGNDFFGALGDIFSCHAVDNPSMESEVEMLHKYGPNVPLPVVRKLVEAFDELRSMADQGLIAYPYSTREIVNIVKHLEVYPNESLTTVIRNVFDFDPYSEEMWETLKKTLQKHGIPIGIETSSINLAKEFPLPDPVLISTWNLKREYYMPLPVERKQILRKQYPNIDVVVDTMDRVDSRAVVFSEEEAHWKIPLSENNVILDVAVTKNGHQMKDLIHVASGNPVQLYSMTPASRNINVLDVFRVFDYTRGSYRPRIRLAALSEQFLGQIVLHEGISNKVFLIDPLTGVINQLMMESLIQATAKEISYRIQGIDKGFYRMCPDIANKNIIVFYQNNGNTIEVMDLDKNEAYDVPLPFKIDDIKFASLDHWMIVEKGTKKKHLMKKETLENGEDIRLLCSIGEQSSSSVVSNMSTESLSPDTLKKVLDKTISAPNCIFNSSDSYATIAIGFPELEADLELHSFQRPSEWVYPDTTLYPKSVFHSGPSQVISAVPRQYHPDYNSASNKELSPAYLEVVDLLDKKVRYVSVPLAQSIPPYTTWLTEISPSHVLIAGTSMDGLVSVDAGGCMRLWETALANLKRSVDAWKMMRGTSEYEKLQLTVDAPAPDLKDLGDPKHGKVDPRNAPHVGGNMWAGGTGGRSTAGLGGVGGPYRLDGGHDVHQVPDYVKDNVPEEVKRAAREMGQRAYKERLRQIKMSEYDAELYEQLMGSIKTHIQSLKVILDSLQAKSKERQWLKHQTYGELDDLKLIDSITGEKSVFKRRGEKDPELGAPQEKPKRLKLVVDVSGSMYRFNGYDGRLHRIMEAALLVMEAFEKYNEKFQYDIVGHSGDGYSLPFVTLKNGPTNNKEKLDILKEMHAHAQFCMSGDHTLEAIVHATETLAKEEADERFVIILSDANLERYGIRPKSFTKVLTTNTDVNAFAIFIGSLGDQAVRLQKALPSGRGFVCLDTKLIPDILRQIFTSSLLQK